MKWIAPHGATSASERYRNAAPTIAGSNPDCAFFNTVLDELLAVIVAADMTPTDENLHQIADAIVYLTERAATSGVTKGAYWFGKTTANFTVPNPTLPEQNYIDFTTLNIYSAKSDLSGWTQTGTLVPPVGIDFTILITSKFWDIPEQTGQQGGEAKYNHIDEIWAYWPKIIEMPAGTNVGDIFYTMRNDNELNGAVECNGATYNTTDFTGAESIGNMLVLNKVPYVSLATYATLLAQNGAVGVFGWDGVGTTAFRVPSLNDIFIETGTAAQIGDYIAPGLPNITATWSNYGKAASAGAGAVTVETQSVGNRDAEQGQNSGKYTFNASRSNVVYGNSNTVQPNTVRYRAMVQLATGATDEALETCTGVLADVAGLKDASNLTATGKLNIINMVMPDYANAENISFPYTPTKSGYISVQLTGSGTVGINIDGVQVNQMSWNGGKTCVFWAMIGAGSTVTNSSASNTTVNSAKFIPCKGV